MAFTKFAKPPTPHQVMIYGHVASALRSFLDSKGWNISQLNEAMGRKGSYSVAYQWLNCKQAPGPVTAKKLSKVTGIPWEQLLKRSPGETPTAVVAPKVVSVQSKATEVLSFRVTNDGNARIMIDVTMPMATATPLLRMLLDAGLVFNEAK
jgi:transcriptional regulator with XRE-family HTH domain